MPGRELCFLSLDGGGVRGLSSLQILKQLMETIAIESQLDVAPKPCEYFDLIGGTSTGGLIAIMLGRLKMDIQDCINAYVDMSDSIFKKKRHRVSVNGEIQGRFDSEELERCVRKIVRDRGFDENELLKDLPDAPCKVFVCTTSKLTSDPVLLTSYRRRRGGGDRLRVTRIWEAARATSAASSFFDPIRIDYGGTGEEFVDGATSANNPVQELWNEAKDIWDPEPLESNLKCFVSIGTGVPSVEPFRTGLLEIGGTLTRIATDTEKKAEAFQRAYSHLDETNRYFRFNVRNGLEHIGLEDASQKDNVMAVTQRYVESQDVFKLMNKCAKNLSERESALADLIVKHIDFHTALIRKTHGIAQAYSKVLHDSDARTIEETSSYDHEKTHRRLARKRLAGTGTWFIKDLRFTEWLQSDLSSILWCTGIIGSDEIRAHAQRTGTAVYFFYCTTPQENEKQGLTLYRSWIKQMLNNLRILHKPLPDAISTDITKYFGLKKTTPDIDDLIDLFLALCNVIGEVIFVLDGFDSLQADEVSKVLKAMRMLLQDDTRRQKARILVFSRSEITAPHLEIARSAPRVIEISTTENISQDIRLYIETLFKDKSAYERELTRNLTLKQQTKQKLLEGAKGMFLWVSLQIEILWSRCFNDGSVRQAIDNLPEDLEETYRQCLDRLDDHYAQKALEWICFARRPLHIEELQEAVSFGLNDKAWNDDERPDAKYLLHCCANLVTLDLTDECVRFIHPSAKEYYQLNCTNTTNEASGDLRCGELCVTYLSFANFGLQIERVIPQNQMSMPPSGDLVSNFVSRDLGKAFSGVMRLVAPRTVNKNSKIIIPITEAKQHASDKYKFLAYVLENWTQHTRTIGPTSVAWEKFQTLALNPNTSWKIHPWESSGISSQSHIHGLLGWAIVENHLPLFKVVRLHVHNDQLVELCRLPIIGTSLPPLHTASRLGFYGLAVHLASNMCDLVQEDFTKRNALSHAAEKGHWDIANLLINLAPKRQGSTLILNRSGSPYDGFQPLHFAAANGHFHMCSRLIENRQAIKIINLRDDHEHTPLYHAALANHESIMSLFMAKGADLGKFHEDKSFTPLHWAAENGFTTFVRILLKKGSDIEARSRIDYTALHLAALAGHVAVIQHLVALGANVNALTSRKQTALHCAVANNHDEAARFLIPLMSDIGALDRGGQTALHLACARDCGAIVQTLISYGANLEAKQDKGMTALHLASIYGSESSVRLLLAGGSDIEATNTDEATALWLAASIGHESIVRQLLSKGANANACNIFGTTALSEAVERERSDIMRHLFQAGANVNIADLQGRTPLYHAAQVDGFGILKALNGWGADLEARNDSGWTAFHAAASRGKVENLRLLKSMGADVNAIDGFKKTALHHACSRSGVKPIHEVIELGVDVNKQDFGGNTALHTLVEFAQYSGDSPANSLWLEVRELLAHGADRSIRNNAGRLAVDLVLSRNMDVKALLSNR